MLIKYTWSHDRAVVEAIQLQDLEVERVKAAINIEKQDLGSTLSDYASWDELRTIAISKGPQQLTRVINDYVFKSKMLDGVFVFDGDVQLLWGMRYDHNTEQPTQFGTIKYKFGSLLAETLRSDTDKFEPFVRLLVIDDSPHLLATSRICNNHGTSCENGFLMFIKKVRAPLINQIEGSTGLDIKFDVMPQEAAKKLVKHDNHSHIIKNDRQYPLSVVVEVSHSIKIPSFLRWDEISALACFSLLMLAFNLFAASTFVSPFRRAQIGLKRFRKTGVLPPDDQFMSYEMQDFARNMKQLIIELEENRKELAWQSAHDPLTSVANRRELERVIKEQIKVKRAPNMLVLLVDIDHFKLYNDNYSHLDGDKVIRKVAQALDAVDFVGEACVARIGGEEFSVCLFSAEPIDATKQAKRLMAAIEQLQIPHEHSPTKSTMTISVGAAGTTNPTLDSYMMMFQGADRALYQSKTRGRNRYTIHNEQERSEKEPTTETSPQITP